MTQQEKKEVRLYTRREVMNRVVATSSVAVASTGLGIWLLNREGEAKTELGRIRDHKVERAAGATEMSIVHGKDPKTNVQKALAALGGMEAFVKRGERVVVKPNVGWNRLAEQAANTHPEVVEEVVRHVVAAGASEVWVTDVPVNNPERCFSRSGIKKAAEAAGAKLILPEDRAWRTISVGGETLRVADVLWPFVEADKVINLPIVKQHGLSVATMSMKNWYGVLGGHRVRLHQKIDQSIVELTAMMKPTLTVLDATRVLMANGPSGGSLDDVKRCDTIAAGIDEVALDAYGVTFLGHTGADLGYVQQGEEAGLGRADYKSLKLEEITG